MSTRKNSSLITHELLLHDAASQGDERKLDDLKVFVKRGKFDINFKDEDWGSRTALHCASERGRVNDTILGQLMMVLPIVGTFF